MTEAKHNKNPSLMNSGPERTPIRVFNDGVNAVDFVADTGERVEVSPVC